MLIRDGWIKLYAAMDLRVRMGALHFFKLVCSFMGLELDDAAVTMDVSRFSSK